jgi:NAD(P)-dependent dehydrogenase (short-subunit alcohol dehydrogenase family)
MCFGLAAEGMKVVVADLDLGAANKVRDDIIAQNGTAIAVQVDSTDINSLARLASEVVERFHGVDALINTVGVILERKLEDVTESDWAWIWKLNVESQIKSVSAFLPYLRESKDAHIVLTASGAGFIATPLAMKIGAYSTTKHALVGYAKSLRNELQGEGIGVTLLCPSGVVGNLAATSAKSHRDFTSEDTPDFGGKQPVGRQLEDSLVMGAIVADAMKQGTFLTSNKKAPILEAIDTERNTILSE